jgi:hypothetical protein
MILWKNKRMIKIANNILKHLQTKSAELEILHWENGYDEDGYGDDDAGGGSILYALGRNAEGNITTALQLERHHGCAYCPGVDTTELAAAYVLLQQKGEEFGGFALVMCPRNASEVEVDTHLGWNHGMMGELPYQYREVPILIVTSEKTQAVTSRSKSTLRRDYRLLHPPVQVLDITGTLG